MFKISFKLNKLPATNIIGKIEQIHIQKKIKFLFY